MWSPLREPSPRDLSRKQRLVQEGGGAVRWVGLDCKRKPKIESHCKDYGFLEERRVGNMCVFTLVQAHLGKV